ncbi:MULTISPECIES: alpha/beta fold hydrolase [Comamonas]|uniref:alpha/beta fold hydrolase n=1 Tax=Comamonas TaxID=283 RepID=UPI0009B8B589|nr:MULTISPECIES: alpha/beta fold hydrolase [Comamonas]TZG06232.1 alpha/beta fold hydrolase [Comamonas thiooxydans]UNV93054.1 alpha/beta hydrolase [Comamonas sp. 7D-2evo1]UNV93647.1 alpha/beta hydrolase [Comamonas sp. 7D-2]UNW02692.1 alpha/beta hydrolase [Comamonas sp. 7D-2evo2]
MNSLSAGLSDLQLPSLAEVGPVVLVLLPGMDGTGELFAPFVAALGKTTPVVVVSYPASGTRQTYTDLTELTTSALPPNGRLVLLGESFSGPIAISLAAAYPERVVGLVLCCSFVRNPRPGLRWLGGLATMPVPLPPAPILNLMLLGRFATPGLRVMLRSALAKVQTAVLRSRLRAVVSVDARAHAKAIDAPVLYLQGIRDRLVPQSSVADAKQCFRKIRVQAFDAPHCLLQAIPQEAAAAVADFVRDVATPRESSAVHE